MGRARFLLCPWFIFNRAAMGRAQFSLCTVFFLYIFFRFVGDQKQTSTWPNNQRDLGHATYVVYSPRGHGPSADVALHLVYLFIFLTARLWAECSSSAVRDLLTARPWADRGS